MENGLFLTNGPVSVRPLAQEDAPLLLKWLTDPRVLEWYEGRDAAFTPERIQEDFYEENEAEPDMRRCVVEYEGAPVGYVQVYPLGGEGFREYGYPTRSAGPSPWTSFWGSRTAGTEGSAAVSFPCF